MRRFLILSHGRAGTNFLGNNLQAHPHIATFLEPFHNDESERVEVRGKKWTAGQSAYDFLQDHVYESVDDKRAAGCKLFFFHCRQDAQSADIWRRAREDRDIKIIFLNRRNLINRVISDLRAERSGVWHPKSEDYLSSQYAGQIALTINPAMMLNRLKDLYCGEHLVREAFAEHPSISAAFEDLATKGEAFLGEVCAFLGVPEGPVVSPFRAGTLSSQTTVITNADELRASLSLTPFETYIDGCPLL